MTEITVLIVEDDDMLREALSDTLQLAGYRPVVAENGEKALQTLGAEHVDLVVTDVQMAAMDGHALLRAVKCRWPQMPVALMTAYGTIEKAVSAMRDGAEDYLVKPFEAEVLIEMVTRLAGCQAPGDETAVMVDERSQKLMALALRVADSEATVMISGESGVGK
ncbi:MAG TPA: sigma-54-dependent Fis family transcriptional regulator, partial [Porticoccaceae bacterium]|nr:sigma-54-dependent Fis family transcriptional regulator [Porticoccaceae bacterium]